MAISTLLTTKEGRDLDTFPVDAKGIFDLVGATLHRSDDDVLTAIDRLLLQFGNDILDGFQGFYWLLKNRHMLDHRPAQSLRFNGPAIVCGSGPSLDLLSDQVKALQNGALIVAAHSTALELIRRGITPQIVCPMERCDFQFMESMTGALPDSVIYAGLPIVPHAWKQFKRHLTVATLDDMYAWAGRSDAQMFTGTSSGTCCAAVAKVIATGPIYLVGCDMTAGHHDGYNKPEDALCGLTVPCVDNVPRGTTMLFTRNRKEYQVIGLDRPIVQCAPQGAAIDGHQAGTLPTYLPDAAVMSVECQHPCVSRRLDSIATTLPQAIADAIHRAERALSLAELSAPAIFDESIAGPMSYVFRSLYAQMSLERRFGVSDGDLLEWQREATINALNDLGTYACDLA